VEGRVLALREGPVTTLVIDRPEKHNALTWEMVAELRRALAEAEGDRTQRVVVLRGAGGRAFCAGADLRAMGGGAEGVESLARHRGRGELAELFRELWRGRLPVVGVVEGWALGGGFGLAMACDLVVASKSACFGLPEVRVGLWPFLVTMPLLRVLPPRRVLELMLTARRLSAEEAAAWGLVTEVASPERLEAAVSALVTEVLEGAPEAIALGRRSFHEVLGSNPEAALGHLHSLLSVAAGGEEAAEGAEARQARRPPRWSPRSLPTDFGDGPGSDAPRPGV
jgi:enoyl-CoA hydratase/carnithine racemase